MGISPTFSSSSFDINQNKNPNPNPNNYSIVRYIELLNLTLIEIKYPDCTNYEGHKILLFQCSMANLTAQKSIDPHFSNNKKFKYRTSWFIFIDIIIFKF
jgi:hypothetical protein